MIKKLLICTHQRYSPKTPSCAGRGSLQLLEKLKNICEEKNIELKEIACFGQCEKGANLRFSPGGDFFHHVTKNNLNTIIDKLDDL
jgi:NADH:ubiquinone oxidoreductase subunit E